LFVFLRVLGAETTDSELNSYLGAYFGDRLDNDQIDHVIADFRRSIENMDKKSWFDNIITFMENIFGANESSQSAESSHANVLVEAKSIASLLYQSTEELTSVLDGLDGGYIKPAPGGGKNLFRLFAVFQSNF
jgi:magnesium chelatase subunit H